MTETEWKKIRTVLKKYTDMQSSLRLRFAAARARLAGLRKASLAKVARWEWCSCAFYDLDPLHFHGNTLTDEKPGKRLTREPLSKLETIRYGFDESGRLLLAEEWGISMEFWEYGKNRVDATRFGPNSRPTRVQSLFLESKMPVAHIDLSAESYGSRSARVQLFQYRGKRMASVVGAHNPHMGRTGGKWWYQHTTIETKSDKIILACVVEEFLGLNKTEYAYPVGQGLSPHLTSAKSVRMRNPLKLKKGRGEPDKNMVGKISKAQLKKLAEEKIKDLNAYDVDAAVRILMGSARSMGVDVID